jgi:formate/nitrite transporter FocA (FNT family)
MADNREDRMVRSPSGAPATGRAVRDIFSADETYQRLTATADHEFSRTARQLLFSGLGAGLALGMVFVGRSAGAAAFGDYESFGANLLYPIGFMIVVLGRYQLYTENTLTPVTLVLTRVASLPSLLRLWTIVFAANVVGAFIIGGFIAYPGVLDSPIRTMGADIAKHAFEIPVVDLFLRGILAGALVGAMVWLTHSVREATARVWIIYSIFLMIPTAGLFHVITGFVEVVFGVFVGEGSWGQAFAFLAAVGLGNTVGGVVLVALLNFGQTRERRVPEGSELEELTWREWLFGFRTGLAFDEAIAPEVVDHEELQPGKDQELDPEGDGRQAVDR